MKRILRRRPSPALAVAALALFVALGGSSYAAITVTNSDIRNNSISGAKISNGSIGATAKLKARTVTNSRVKARSLRGNRFAQDSIGGNAVKEQSLDAMKLGTVRAAENADAVGGIAVTEVEPFTLAVGQDRGVATVAPFAITARCRAVTVDEATEHVAEIVVQTNQNGAAVAAEQNVPVLNIGALAQLVAAQAAPGTPAFGQTAGIAVAPNGTTVHSDGLYAGTEVLGAAANQCRFGGSLGVVAGA